MTDTQAPAPTLNREQRRKLAKEMKSKAPKRCKLLPKHTLEHCAAMWRVFAKTEYYTEGEQAELMLPIWVAFDNIRTGKGTDSDINTLLVYMHAASDLSKGVHQECVDVVRAALRALRAIVARYCDTKRVLFSNLHMLEKDAVQAGIELYEEYIRHITPQQNTKAIKHAQRVVENKTFLEEA